MTVAISRLVRSPPHSPPHPFPAISRIEKTGGKAGSNERFSSAARRNPFGNKTQPLLLLPGQRMTKGLHWEERDEAPPISCKTFSPPSHPPPPLSLFLVWQKKKSKNRFLEYKNTTFCENSKLYTRWCCNAPV